MRNGRGRVRQVRDGIPHLHAANIKITGEEPEYFAEYKVIDIAAELERERHGATRARRVGLRRRRRLLGAVLSPPPAGRPASRASTCRKRAWSSARPSTARRLASSISTALRFPFRPRRSTSASRPACSTTFRTTSTSPCSASFTACSSADGLLFIFEHNPLNPLTRHAVNTCPFDVNARLILAGTMRSRVHEAGFAAPRIRYRIFFPHQLRDLAPLRAAAHVAPSRRRSTASSLGSRRLATSQSHLPCAALRDPARRSTTRASSTSTGFVTTTRICAKRATCRRISCASQRRTAGPCTGRCSSPPCSKWTMCVELQWLRFTAVVLSHLAAVLVWRLLHHSGWSATQAVAIGLAITFLPSSQVILGWSIAWPIALSLVFALLGFRATEARARARRSRAVRVVDGGRLVLPTFGLDLSIERRVRRGTARGPAAWCAPTTQRRACAGPRLMSRL